MITGEQARVQSTDILISKNKKVFEDIDKLVQTAISDGQFEVNYTLKAMQNSQHIAIIDFLTHLGYKVLNKQQYARSERDRYSNLYEMDLYISW